MASNLFSQCSQSAKDGNYSKFFVPNKWKEKENVPSKGSLNLKESNYVSVIKNDFTAPLPTARSNMSYEDTPRNAHTHRSSVSNTYRPYQVCHRELEFNIMGDDTMNNRNESALQHWLSDTQLIVDNLQEKKSEVKPESGRPLHHHLLFITFIFRNFRSL